MSGATQGKTGLKPVYLITGSDEPKIEKAVRRLKERVVKEAGTDLNVDVFDAAQEAAFSVVQAANTLPFGEGTRLVLVNNVGAWHKAEKDVITAYLASPAQHSCLALVGGPVKKTEQLYKMVDEVGQVLAYEAPRPAQLPRWAQEQAKERRLQLGPEEARRLTMLTGANQRAIIGELDKLAAYKGQGSVEMSDIDNLAWVAPEVRVWDLTDAVGARDKATAFRRLEELLADHAAPNMVFFSLANHLRRLCEIAAARDRGEEPLRAAAALGLKPYPAKKAVEQSRNFDSGALKRAVELLADLDADLKGRSDLRSDLALEMALAAIMELA